MQKSLECEFLMPLLLSYMKMANRTIADDIIKKLSSYSNLMDAVDEVNSLEKSL